MYLGAWGLGGDPAPNGLYARDAKFNYTRFATPEHDEILKKFTSDESFDPEFRKNAFFEWQKYMNEEVPAIPTLYRYSVTAVNNRVNKYSIDPNSPLEFWHTVELTADAPVAE